MGGGVPGFRRFGVGGRKHRFRGSWKRVENPVLGSWGKMGGVLLYFLVLGVRNGRFRGWFRFRTFRGFRFSIWVPQDQSCYNHGHNPSLSDFDPQHKCQGGNSQLLASSQTSRYLEIPKKTRKNDPPEKLNFGRLFGPPLHREASPRRDR